MSGSVLEVKVHRPASGSMSGFHVTRTQWDPYPWVSAVDAGSAAEAAGLRAGDCVLKVNGDDVLGQRMTSVASRVRAQPTVTLLLWRAEAPPSVWRGGTAGGVARLAAAVPLFECPVCLEPPADRVLQCVHGHIMCSRCRARTDKCPVCRVTMGPRYIRCLLADHLLSLLRPVIRRNHSKPDSISTPNEDVEVVPASNWDNEKSTRIAKY